MHLIIKLLLGMTEKEAGTETEQPVAKARQQFSFLHMSSVS
jgi:hypothetical protein